MKKKLCIILGLFAVFFVSPFDIQLNAASAFGKVRRYFELRREKSDEKKVVQQCLRDLLKNFSGLEEHFSLAFGIYLEKIINADIEQHDPYSQMSLPSRSSSYSPSPSPRSSLYLPSPREGGGFGEGESINISSPHEEETFEDEGEEDLEGKDIRIFSRRGSMACIDNRLSVLNKWYFGITKHEFVEKIGSSALRDSVDCVYMIIRYMINDPKNRFTSSVVKQLREVARKKY